MQFNITVFGYEVGVSIEREQETVFDPEIPALIECDQCGEVHFEDKDCSGSEEEVGWSIGDFTEIESRAINNTIHVRRDTDHSRPEHPALIECDQCGQVHFENDDC